jgi:hypothetical protein
MFGHSDQASPISEGVVEIRINIHLAKDKPDNMTHMSNEDPRVAIIHNTIKESG